MKKIVIADDEHKIIMTLEYAFKKAGYYADLVLFDPDTIQDHATIQNPQALSDGILKVWVNGELVYSNKAFMGTFPGRLIKR